MCMGAHMPQYVCGSQKAACGSEFSFSTIWVPVAELRSSGMGTRDVTKRDISLASTGTYFLFEKGSHVPQTCLKLAM